jgi:hypothetical protein
MSVEPTSKTAGPVGAFAPAHGSVLFIPLKREYFEAFERGEKRVEYRPYGPRWNERTCAIGKRVVLSLGYGKQHRIAGRVVSFEKSREPLKTLAWLKCYGHRTGDCACVGIELDARNSEVSQMHSPRSST